MMTNRELGAKIRAELKAAGIPARAVSVRVKDAGYSTSVHVSIKDINVSLEKVKRIAEGYEEIRRDERSCEILEGCNTFVFVEYDYDMRRVEREKYMEEAQRIIDENTTPCVGVDIAKNGQNRLVYFGGVPGSIDNQAVIIRKDGLRNYHHDRYIAHNAYHLAEALAHFNARGAFI